MKARETTLSTEMTKRRRKTSRVLKSEKGGGKT